MISPDLSTRLELRPNWTHPTTPFRHTWEGVINVDQFRWLGRRDTQDHLRLAQRELGARHVRAAGMFDDEMRVFCPSPESFMGLAPKIPRSNWQITNYAIDSLLDLGLNPLITTAFIPSAMASGPTTVFTTRAHTSPPKDWKQWGDFVRESVEALVVRYTLPVVRQWYFEAWNEPNLQGWFWGGDQNDYFKLWATTYRAIKSVDASFRVGGPSTGRAVWVEDLLAYGRKHDCVPDYLITHIYNNDSLVGDALAPFDGPQADRVNQSPNYAVGVMRGVHRLVADLGFKGEVHWNEWGRSFHGIDHRRENPSEAAFIVRLLDQVSQEAEVFSYWCLTDIYDQVGYGREAFHGGYGLLSLQGLRKPSYHAFQLLSRLGTRRVALSGEACPDLHGAIATSSQRQHHVLVYAYQHDDQPTVRSVTVSINLPADAGKLTLYRVDSQENNVIARWRDLGSPVYLSREQTRDLTAANPLIHSSSPVQVSGSEGEALAQFTMESPGIALLEIERR